MKIAHNPETGEYLGLQGGRWQKLQVAANDAGEKLYLGPDGWLPLDTGSAANPNSPAQERGAGRSLGLGTRNVLEGVGGLVGSVVNPFANLVNSALGGDPHYFKNPGEAAADVAGFATPQNSAERVAGDVISGAAAALPTLGAGLALQSAGRAPQIAAALSDMPILQGVSGAFGGSAMGGAREGGAGVGGQLAAGLAAGVLPFGAAAAGRVGLNELRSVAGAADRLTASGQQRLAGTFLERMARDPNAVRNTLENGGSGVLVDGSMPTAAQLTADPGLALVEKGMASTPGGVAIRDRYTAQQDAQREALNALLSPVAERQAAAIDGVGAQLSNAAPYGATMNELQAGRQIRGAYDSEYGAMRDKVNQAYQSIDPEGKTRVDAQPLLDRWMQRLDPDDIDDLPPLARKEFGRLAGLMESGEPVTFDRLQKARTRIANSAPIDDKNGQRLVGIMKRQLDDFINNMALAPEQASAFENAKALRQAQGARFEQGPNVPLSQRGDALGGQQIADSAIPGNYFVGGAKGYEGMGAFGRSVGGSQEAQAAIADHIMSTAIRGSMKDGVVDPGKLAGFLETYRPALESLDNADINKALANALEAQRGNFAARDAIRSVATTDKAGNWQLVNARRQFPEVSPQAGLTADEAAQLGAIQADVKRGMDTVNMAGVNGSPTAQINRLLEDLKGYRFGTMGGGGYTRNLVNRVMSSFVKDADDNIERMLIDSVLDPEYALKLMQNTNNAPGLRQWAARGGKESYSDMLRRYGVQTSIGAARNASQAQ